MADSKLGVDTVGRKNREGEPDNPFSAVVAAQRLLQPAVDSTIYNPTTIHSIMKAAEIGDIGRQLQMWQRMIEADAHLASVVQTRRLVLSSATFRLETPPGLEEDSAALLAVDYCRAVLDELQGWPQAIATMADGGVVGFRALEIEWDGVRPLALHDTPEEAWRWTTGGLQVQDANGRWLPVEPDKFVIHSPRGNSSSIARRGAMRSVAFAWVLKHYATRDWAAFVEVFGTPPRVAYVPPEWGASDPRITDLYNALSDMGSDGVAVLNAAVKVEAMGSGMSSSASGWTPHSQLVLWADQQFSKAVLGQTLTTDTSGSTGTYAAATIHNEVRLDIAQADATDVADTVRRDLLTPTVGYGLGWDAPVPVVVMEVDDAAEEARSAEKLDKAVNKLGLPVPAAEAYRLLNIQEPVDDEPLLEGESKAVAVGGFGVPNSSEAPDGRQELEDIEEDQEEAEAARSQQRGHQAATEGLGEVPTALAALASFSAQEWGEMKEHLVMNDVAVILEQNPELDLAGALERLAYWYPSLPTEELEAAIHQTMMASTVNGLVELDHEAGNPPEDRQAEEAEGEEA